MRLWEAYCNRLSLLFWTTRYLSPTQVLFRLRRMLRRKWWQVRKRPAPQPIGWKLASSEPLYVGLSHAVHQGPWMQDVDVSVEQARGVFDSHFCFLNQRHNFTRQIDWHLPTQSQLWRYHLHYFGYVDDLLIWSASGNSPDAYEAFRRLVGSWINENRVLAGDGWHPYTVSLRVVNWVHALLAFQSELSKDEPFRQRFLKSLYGQGRVLANDLELDVRGNHLLKNLKALIWLGIVFKGVEPQKWLQEALERLECELAEQITPDGGHFERAPGYHLNVIKDCIEISIWLQRNQQISPFWLNGALRRMLDYLVTILPPDRKIPLLKDTAWDASPSPSDLLAAAGLYLDISAYKYNGEFGLYPLLLFGLQGWKRFKTWPQMDLPRNSVALPAIGHYVMRDDSKGDYLIFDVGKACPDYLPAHAHADTLSYELVVDGQRVVVDSGVYEYAAGPWRDFFRSTRAHNTVEVASENQSEVWNSFRVARRARPRLLIWKAMDSYVMAQGQHDGYRRLSPPVVHRRTIVWQKARFWLIVDELLGKGMTRVASRVHLHPQLTLETLNDSTWHVKGCACSLWLSAFGEQNHSVTSGQTKPLRDGWYSERFGQLESNTVLTLHKATNLPFCYGYIISLNEPVKVQCTGTSVKRLDIALIHGRHSYRLRIGTDEMSYLQ